MKHKKKATRRILKGGFELPSLQNWWKKYSWLPWNTESKSVSAPEPDDKPPYPVAVADPSSVSAYEATSPAAPLPVSAPLPGSAPPGSAPLPGSGGKKHKKKRSLKRNTKKRN